MARVELFTEPEQTEGDRREAFDHIISSRGSIPLPLAPLIAAPGVAMATADLGSAVREGTLTERARELVIATTAHQRNCHFEWEVHSALAVEAGVDRASIEAVRRGEDAVGTDRAIVEFVRGSCSTGDVADELFDEVVSMVGEEGVVEMVALVGYYTYIALVMSILELE